MVVDGSHRQLDEPTPPPPEKKGRAKKAKAKKAKARKAASKKSPTARRSKPRVRKIVQPRSSEADSDEDSEYKP